MNASQWIPVNQHQFPYLESNLEVLQTNLPDLYKRAIAVLETNRLRLRKGENNYWEGALLNENDLEIILPSSEITQNLEITKISLNRLSPPDTPSLIFILGLDFGYSLELIRSYSELSTYKGFLIVEPNLNYFVLTLATAPLQETITSNRVFWIIGENWQEELQRTFIENHLFIYNQLESYFSTSAAIGQRKQIWNLVNKYSQHFSKDGFVEFKKLMNTAVHYYNQKQPHQIHRIMAIRVRGGMAVRYIQQRFLDECEKMGIEITYYTPSIAGGMSFLHNIATKKPDLIFFVNWDPYQYTPAPLLRQLRVPCVTWCIDDPNSFLQQGNIFGNHDFVLTWDLSYKQNLKDKNALSVDFFPYVADLDHANPKVREEFRSPVSYIGQVAEFNPEKLGIDPGMVELIKKVAEEKVKDLSRSYQSLLLEFQEQWGLRIVMSGDEIIPRHIRYGIYVIANALWRIRVLKTVMPFGLKFYGNEDWVKVLGDDPLINCYQGPADPQFDVPDIFISTDINLNIHSIQALSSLNQRDFNCPLSGGFLLTDWVEHAGMFFQPDEELIFYYNLDDLKQKISFYLENKELRDTVIRKGMERVKKEHTYSTRVPKILDTLKTRIQERYGIK